MSKPKPLDNAPIIGGARDNPYEPLTYTEWKAKRRAKMRRGAIKGAGLIAVVIVICVGITLVLDIRPPPMAREPDRWAVTCKDGIKGEFIGDRIRIDDCDVVQLTPPRSAR